MNTKTNSHPLAQDPLLIALYLPQFHPIPENDAAWGPGFTEWNNVVRAAPRFDGHRQPQLPRDLGFYDLRLDATRARQAEIAKEHGIDAFCYYSYWLDDRTILGLPIELELRATDRDFPVCMCWANENWTRAWDGREADQILKQGYGAEGIESYCRYLVEKFKHPRYLKLEGRPIFLVYSPEEIPSDIDFPGTLRAIAARSGVPNVHLVAVKHGRAKLSSADMLSKGYDAVMLFQPNQQNFPAPKTGSAKIKSIIRKLLPRPLYNLVRHNVSSYQAIDYAPMAKALGERPLAEHELPCVFPSWDNTARRSISTVIQNENPAEFGQWLKKEMAKVSLRDTASRVVFINAWNEWAEGCHLEPDQMTGHQYLEQVRACRELSYER